MKENVFYTNNISQIRKIISNVFSVIFQTLTHYPHKIEDAMQSKFQITLFLVVLACTPIGLHTKAVFRHNSNKLHVEHESLIDSKELRTI